MARKGEEKLTQEQIKWLKGNWEHITNKDIVEETGLCVTSIYNYARKLGLPTRQRRYENLIGRKKGRLECIKDVGGPRIVCRCQCGVEFELLRQNFRQGNTLSCGCLRHEINSVHPNKRGELSKDYKEQF